ncbi:MAG TPA: TetR family transcriptional regulator [Kofleriaceae bacterium]|nr:TetR family transcriptional regulator [Kofleriaceae bacterium]
MRPDPSHAILDAATALAAEGGFDNVRQRDVAERAGVSLATLYRRYRSKEDLLAAALERKTRAFELTLEARPAAGPGVRERLAELFRRMTAEMLDEPLYARAVIRAVSSGDPQISGRVAAYHGRIAGLVIAAMRGRGSLDFMDAHHQPPTEAEIELASYLMQIWFACMVGWSSGMLDGATVDERVRRAIELLAPPLGF